MAGGKQITILMRLRSSRFMGSLRRVQTAVKAVATRIRAMSMNLAGALKNAMTNALRLGAQMAVLGGVIAGIAALRGFIKLGAELDHLKDQAGMGAGELLVLKQAFEDAGVDGDQVGKVINKMQKSIVDASRGSIQYVRSLKAIGLSSRELLKMNTQDQFKAIINGLNKQENQAIKTAVAMDLLGRGGGALMPMIKQGEDEGAKRNITADMHRIEAKIQQLRKKGGKEAIAEEKRLQKLLAKRKLELKAVDPKAIADAKVALGQLPDAMDRMSKIMERIDTILGRLKMKVFQFIAPLIEHFAVRMQGAMNQLNAFDFTALGKKFAKFVLAIIELVKAGKLGQLLSDTIAWGVLKGLSALIPAIEAVWKAGAKIGATILSEMLAGIVNNLPAPLKLMMGMAPNDKMDAGKMADDMAKRIDKLNFKGIGDKLGKMADGAGDRVKALIGDAMKKIQLKKVTDPVDDPKKSKFGSLPLGLRLVADSMRAIGGGGNVIGGGTAMTELDIAKQQLKQQLKGFALFKAIRDLTQLHLNAQKELADAMKQGAPKVV